MGNEHPHPGSPWERTATLYSAKLDGPACSPGGSTEKAGSAGKGDRKKQVSERQDSRRHQRVDMELRGGL